MDSRPPLPRNESRGDVLASSPNRRHQALALPDHLERVGRRCASLPPSPTHLLPPLPRRRPQWRPDPASATACGARPCPPAARLLGGSRGSPSRWISWRRAHAPRRRSFLPRWRPRHPSAPPPGSAAPRSVLPSAASRASPSRRRGLRRRDRQRRWPARPRRGGPAAAAVPPRRLPRLSRTRLLAVIPTPSLLSSLRRCLAGSAPLGRAGAGLRGGPPAAARSASARPAAEAACEPAAGRTGGRGGSSSPSSSAPSTPAPRRPPHSLPPSRAPSGGGWPDPRPPARGHDGGGGRGGPLP